jgi:hypothetical protein
MDGKWILWIFLLLGSVVYGQSFQYSYTDPCTGILQTVIITQPSGSVTLFYAGQYQTFTAAQLQSGGYEAWVQGINSTFPPGSNPCAGGGSTITTGSNASIGTNTVNNVSGIVSIAAGIGGSIGSSALPGGGAVTGGGTSNTGNNDNSSNNSNSGSSSNGSGSSSTSSGSGSGGSGSGSGSSGSSGSGGGSGSGSGSSGSGGSGSSGGGGSGSSGGGSTGSGGGSSGRPDGGSGGATGNPGSSQEGTGGSLPAGSSGGSSEGGAVGGSDNTTTASGGESENSSSEGGGSGGGGQKQKNKQEKVGRGALIGSGDFVAIRNSSDIQQSGNDNFRFNMSLTHVNTKQNFIKGVNLNFTTGENVLNTTFYGSYKAKGFMGVFSNSVMTNFKSDIFNTTTALAAQKTGKVTWMGGTNLTIGAIGKSGFQNWSLVGGGFTNFKGGKAISANIMALGIYSPYIFYYEGQWYKSGILLVPLANLDIKLTDKFKWSLSFSGAYQWNADILNYQLSTGTKMLL